MRDILVVVLFISPSASKKCDITKNKFHGVRQPEEQMPVMLAT